MGDFVLKSGDVLRITVAPPAVVPALAAPLPLKGSSSSVTVGGSPACVMGDELPDAVRQPLSYTAPPFTNPGTGKVQILLTPRNTTAMTSNGPKLLLKGGPFPVVFTVTTPATQTTPAGPVPDPVLVKNFTASFVTTNTTVTAG
ncbi:hypothetical protein [Lentzea sp. NPDC059081]|uniref:hypothetical protein n=1 Tax=Lentzea sp. NPDC059081 TaxID=3346719 RepID=UPI0036AAFA37